MFFFVIILDDFCNETFVIEDIGWVGTGWEEDEVDALVSGDL